MVTMVTMVLMMITPMMTTRTTTVTMMIFIVMMMMMMVMMAGEGITVSMIAGARKEFESVDVVSSMNMVMVSRCEGVKDDDGGNGDY